MAGILQGLGLQARMSPLAAEHMGFRLAAPVPEAAVFAPAVQFEQAAAAPDPALLKTIDWGTQIADASTVTVYFAAKNEKMGGETCLGWTDSEKQPVMLAFEQYEHIINIDVQITTSKAGARGQA